MTERSLCTFISQLWYAAGDFYHSRYMSKQLVRIFIPQLPKKDLINTVSSVVSQSLFIKAEELGLNAFDHLASVPAEALSPDQAYDIEQAEAGHRKASL